MKSDKHAAKKQEILESAFRTWGRNRYQNTSLADLASAHNITKQALYCYFTSKEKLEQAMEETALKNYIGYAEELHRRLSKLTGDRFTESYMNESVDYMLENSHYMCFLAYRYRRDDLGHAVQRTLAKKFADLAMKNAGIPDVGMRYLNALVFMRIQREPTGKPWAGDWETAWKKGFASEKLTSLPDFSQLLSDASVVDYSPFGDDPLIRAVFEAVMEEAGNGVSLEKIARKAGLTKSSLYNYWPSKEEMLSDVLSRQISIFSWLFNDFSRAYVRPADRLFSYLAFTATFLRRTPEVLNYMQRIMSFGIPMPRSKKDIYGEFTQPLLDILNLGILDLGSYEPGEFLALVNLAGVNEIKHHLTEASVRSRIDQCLKDLYLLISGGISTLRSNPS